MCPTEIYYDGAEEPYNQIAAIESRKGDESIAALKHKPVEWVKVKLNLASQEEMATAMSSLAPGQIGQRGRSRRLGLLDETDFVTTHRGS
jgi:hypothetical protein